MNDLSRPAITSRFVAVLTLGGLVLILAFTWRVVMFMNAIRRGAIGPSELSFKNSFTPAKKLPSIPSASGSVSIERADAFSLGSEQAALRIVEFADFGCPYSQQSSFVIRTLAQKYGNRIRYSYRHFPLTDVHPDARQAAEAVECAGAQGKFWEYHDKLFLNQADLSHKALVHYAKEINLDSEALDACVSSGRFASRVQTDIDAGIAAGVAGTPTFFFNGFPIAGAIPENVFEQLIQRFTKT